MQNPSLDQNQTNFNYYEPMNFAAQRQLNFFGADDVSVQEADEKSLRSIRRLNFQNSVQKMLFEEQSDNIFGSPFKGTPQKNFCKRLSFDPEDEGETYTPNTFSTRSTISNNSIVSSRRDSRIAPFDNNENNNPNNNQMIDESSHRMESFKTLDSIAHSLKIKTCISQSTADSDTWSTDQGENRGPLYVKANSFDKDPSSKPTRPRANLFIQKSRSGYSSTSSFFNSASTFSGPSTAASVIMDVENDSFSIDSESPSVPTSAEFLFQKTSAKLPTVPNCEHSNVATITAKTMNELLTSNVNHHEFLVIDCRYEYEYKGGHITGAINITDPLILERLLITNAPLLLKQSYLNDIKADFNNMINSFVSLDKYENEPNMECLPIIIFHCEFSSERGPRMFKHFRTRDRELNQHRYPLLDYPEIYLLGQGYRNFHKDSPECCSPAGAYIEMKDSMYKDKYIEASKLDHQYWNKKTSRIRSSQFKMRAFSQII